MLLGLLLNKDTEGLGLSRDMASTRVAASSGAVPKGTEASFPWLAQPPYTGGSLNESFLPAEATRPAHGSFTIPRSGLPHPASREITQATTSLGIVHRRLWEKDPAGTAYRSSSWVPEVWTTGLSLIFWEAEPTGSVAAGHRQGPG